MKTAIVKKIVIFGVINAVISLTLACIVLSIVEFDRIKNESVVRLTSEMDVLAYNLQSTLLFDDKEAAEKTLLALEGDQSINRVRLYKSDGTVLASFIRNDNPGDVQLYKDIYYKDKLLGRLQIESIYLGLQEKIVAYLLICLVIIIMSIPASHLISAPIRRQVSLGVIQLEDQSNRLRKLAAQVTNTEQMERKRIAAIIHDHLQQLLVACKLHLGSVLKDLEKKQYDKAEIGLGRVNGFINEATRAAKTLTVELRPPVLYEDGLKAAFEWLANKFKTDHDLAVTLHLEDITESLPDTLKIMIFESVKELLFNVVKYAGVKTAELYLSYHPDGISVVVKDKGRGFDSQNMEKMSSNKGFGLFSIRERLKLINGDIKISSELMRGTTIEVNIPVTIPVKQLQKEKALVSEKEALQKGTGKRINILMADDHTIVREGIANILKENPLFNVIAQAENGVEAVEKAEMFKPDIVIMDINMPRLNGIEATRVIKNKFPDIDIIGLSVQDESNIAESMKKAGAVALLNKGGDPQDLIRTIMACKLKRMIV